MVLDKMHAGAKVRGFLQKKKNSESKTRFLLAKDDVTWDDLQRQLKFERKTR